MATAQTTTNRRTPDGPRGHFILGALPEFRREPTQAFLAGFRQYGDIVKFRGRGPMYLTAHPDHVKYVMQDNHQNYPHPTDFNDKFRVALGNGLVTIEGEEWLQQRRLMQPAFHRQRIAAFATTMVEAIDELLERWARVAARGDKIDIRVEMMRVTLDVLARTLFSADLSRDIERMGEAVSVEFEHVNHSLLSLINPSLRVPTPRNRRFLTARRTLDRIVYRLIRERRRSGEDTGDLLSMLIQARDEETGEGMTDKQVRDEIMTIIFAGHETVSTALTWVWYLLSKHPDVARRLRAEAEEVLGDRAPTVADVPNLKLTTMVLEETMRLYPPLWLVTRSPLKDDEIGGYHIEAGSTILLSAFVTHRHPAFWDNPEGFDPERFTPERSAGRHRYAYFAFAGGPRRCIGVSFGMLEMQLLVAMVARRFRLDLAPGHPIALQADISLRPRHGMPMTVHPHEA